MFRMIEPVQIFGQTTAGKQPTHLILPLGLQGLQPRQRGPISHSLHRQCPLYDPETDVRGVGLEWLIWVDSCL
jgi:hypothetical protein